MVYKLLEKGVLNDKDGNLSETMKSKILEMIGFGAWENAKDLNDLQIKRADKENLEMIEGNFMPVREIDDHELHINEHIAYMLSGDYDKVVTKEIEDIFLKHIETHKSKLKEG